MHVSTVIFVSNERYAAMCTLNSMFFIVKLNVDHSVTWKTIWGGQVVVLQTITFTNGLRNIIAVLENRIRFCYACLNVKMSCVITSNSSFSNKLIVDLKFRNILLIFESSCGFVVLHAIMRCILYDLEMGRLFFTHTAMALRTDLNKL